MKMLCNTKNDASTRLVSVVTVLQLLFIFALGVAGCASTPKVEEISSSKLVRNTSREAKRETLIDRTTPNPYQIVVSIKEQRLVLIKDRDVINTFIVSTALNGAGETEGSNATPRGTHFISEKIGAGEPEGMVFAGLQPTEEIVEVNAPNLAPVVSRVLRLSGLEASNLNTYNRLIYLHGSPVEDLLGVPASAGCIRMRSKDIIALFDRIPVGTRVHIFEESMHTALQTLDRNQRQRVATEELAVGGDTNAIHSLCFGLSYGANGLEIDENRAFKWCSQGMQAGIPSSMILLAEAYEFGRGTTVDLPRARAVYVLAANAKHPHGQTKAAIFFWNGLGGSRDIAKSRSFLEQAISQNHEPAKRFKREIDEALKNANATD
jgi:lipoprotein-anchoring transpeptidase ErfK/SrfK